MKIALVGLGKMGAQIARRWVEHGHQVIAVDPNREAVQAAAAFGAIGALDRSDALGKFEGDQAAVWLMIPSQFVDSEVDEWLKILPKGSLLIDGGNSDFRQTKERAEKCGEKQIKMLDVGVSGGILGLENGFSMMAGGDQDSYDKIKPLLDALAHPHGGHAYFGDPGSGHYVKMVHNAIEYGMMESLAEGYEMLKKGPYRLDLAAAGRVWQQESVIMSNLNGLAAQIMQENPELDGVKGYVAENGEARWTLELSKAIGVELPAIQTALDVRIASQNGDVTWATKLLAELRNKFGGHALNKAG